MLLFGIILFVVVLIVGLCLPIKKSKQYTVPTYPRLENSDINYSETLEYAEPLLYCDEL